MSSAFALLMQTTCYADGFHIASANQHQMINFGNRVATTQEIVDYLAPAQPMRRRGLRVLDTEAPSHRTRTVSMQINFGFNSDELNEKSLEQLKPVGKALVSNQLRSLHFTLEGHTDAKGSNAYNLGLSKRRAVRVKEFFMHRYGVSAERIIALGRGEEQLLHPDRPYSGVNRRVTITADYD
jgi:outer membrane protein OmpA-like peptidoglycan-associated protein